MPIWARVSEKFHGEPCTFNRLPVFRVIDFGHVAIGHYIGVVGCFKQLLTGAETMSAPRSLSSQSSRGPVANNSSSMCNRSYSRILVTA
jgi:hypothetical protein